MDRDRDEDRRDALSKEYGEVCQNFRTLTDIRFRLLTLLPIATAAAAAFKGDGTVGGSFVLPLFGLLATIGLVTYNTRNDQLYDYLVGRAACIERSLGLADGAFANRPAVWLSFRLLDIDHEKLLALVAQRVSDGRVLRRIEAMLTAKWEVDHRTAVSTIYWASIVVWLFLLLASLSAPLVSNSGSVWASLASLAVFGVAVVAAWSARTWIMRKKEEVEENMQCLAAKAVQKALSANLSPDHPELIASCAEIVGDKDVISARAQFYAAVDRNSSGYFVPCGSKLQAACHLVALLTDLPPRWLFDCATNRRGVVKIEKESPQWFPLRADDAT